MPYGNKNSRNSESSFLFCFREEEKVIKENFHEIFGSYSSHVLFNQILRLLPALGSIEDIGFIVKSVIDGGT